MEARWRGGWIGRCVVAVLSGGVASTAAIAGGLAVREQSAQYQGSSFAGAAAGGALSSSFWNPAAISQSGSGLQSESAYSLVIPNASVTAFPGTQLNGGSDPVGEAVSFGRLAAVPASYHAYRLNSRTVVGLAINSPFGLANEFDSPTWAGQQHGRSGKIFTVNFNPNVSYNLLPDLAIAAGAQIQYAQVQFKSNPSAPGAGALPSQSNIGFDVDDVGFGGTLGLLWSPAAGTSVGLGYRSTVTHNLEGTWFKADNQINVGAPVRFAYANAGLKAEITLPEMVTLSLRQSLSSSTRLLGTVEWTRWSRLTSVDFVATTAGGGPGATAIGPGQTVSRFDFNWHDGWLFSLGGEWDYSSALTLRAGAGYELSPIQNANERFTLITDSDRTWLSGGLSYKVTSSATVDLGYSHIFFADAPIDRATTTKPDNTGGRFTGEAKQSVDVISAGLKIKW